MLQIWLAKKDFYKEGLPCKAKFYNSLTNCVISDKNYEHVLKINKAFKI